MNWNVRLVGQLVSLFSSKCTLVPINVTATASYHQSMVRDAASKNRTISVPPKPKRPLTAYFQYLIEQRPLLVKQYPNAKQTEIIRMIADKWSNESEAVKSTLIDRFRDDQETYRNQIDKYNSTLTDDEKLQLFKLRKMKQTKKQRSIIKKKSKNFGKPKRPLNGFMLFLNDEKAAAFKRGSMLNTKQAVIDFVRAAKQNWMTLDTERKELYLNRAKLARIPYELELLDWEEKMIADGHFDVVRKKNLQRKRFETTEDSKQ